jgi:hypothetical protein
VKIHEDTCIGNYFLNRTPIAQERRTRMNKWDCIKLNNFSTSKEQVPEGRDSSQNGRKSLLLFINKGLISITYEELKKYQTPNEQCNL